MNRQALIASARQIHLSGRLSEAAAVYARILSKYPADADALYGLAMVHAQSGRLAKAEEMLTVALAQQPEFAEGWRAKGLVLQHLGRPTDAMACYDISLMLAPEFAAARRAREFLLREIRSASSVQNLVGQVPQTAHQWNENGSRLAAAGHIDEALASFERAISLAPENVEALCNNATVLFAKGLSQEALAVFDHVIGMDPDCALAWNNRGNALLSLGRRDEAIASYGRALEIQPNLVEAAENRELALFISGRNRRSPPNYLRALFDEFAGHYDRAMIEGLEYSAHLLIRDLAVKHLRSRAPSVLDLGCGTGLVGKALKEVLQIERLEGVDISPRMIAAAKDRGLYDNLMLGDIETVLAESGPPYDAILASDALNYFGDLSGVFAAASRRLKPDGVLIFTTERFDGEDWEQTPVRRFRHSRQYVYMEAARMNSEVAEVREWTLRLESGVPVAGFGFVLHKPSAELK